MLTLRPAALSDADILLVWRNDPLTRVMSISTDEVAPKDHAEWLKCSLINPDRILLIAEINGQPVGTVRVDFGRELSWIVAPDYRGNGVGATMLKVAVAQFSETLVARIKPENTASRRIAEKAGFTRSDLRKGLEIWVRISGMPP